MSSKPLIAVAGGTGGIGAPLVDEILEAGYPVAVLTRSPNQKLAEKGVQVRVVDYDKMETLLDGLKDVHTVISCLSALSQESFVKPQLALLDAAVRSGSVKRFAPSEWFGNEKTSEEVGYERWKRIVMDAVKKSGLEYTHFANGVIMNYLSIGNPHGLGGMGTLEPFIFSIDIQNFTATIPGTGNDPFVLTRVEDIAKFVTASLALEKWPEFLGMAGDITTLNEILHVAEAVREKPFTTKYIPEAEIKARMRDNPDSIMTNFGHEVFLALLKGDRLNFDPNLNKLCPKVEPMKAKEFIEFWWHPRH
jgi:uncharacterized protein YbjT (DUF2867 family)